MAESEPKRIGFTIEVKPHAYDPVASPELFEGVLARRVVAFFIDVIIITVPLLFAGLFIFLFGLFTFFLGWFLFLLLPPAAAIWTTFYYALTFGRPASATIPRLIADPGRATVHGEPAMS